MHLISWIHPRGSETQINAKTPPILYNITINGFTERTKWRLNKILTNIPAGHP
jgi:hypothetical protein